MNVVGERPCLGWVGCEDCEAWEGGGGEVGVDILDAVEVMVTEGGF